MCLFMCVCVYVGGSVCRQMGSSTKQQCQFRFKFWFLFSDKSGRHKEEASAQITGLGSISENRPRMHQPKLERSGNLESVDPHPAPRGTANSPGSPIYSQRQGSPRGPRGHQNHILSSLENSRTKNFPLQRPIQSYRRQIPGPSQWLLHRPLLP